MTNKISGLRNLNEGAMTINYENYTNNSQNNFQQKCNTYNLHGKYFGSSLCNYYQIKKQTKCTVYASLYLLERTLQQAIYLFSNMFRFKKAAERSLIIFPTRRYITREVYIEFKVLRYTILKIPPD